MKRKIIYSLFITIVLGFLLYLQIQRNSTIKEKKYEIKTFIKHNFNDPTDSANYILYYYNGFDCNKCIANGFKIIKHLSNEYHGSIFIFSKNADASSDSIIYGSCTTINSDIKSNIHDYFNYLPTPYIAIKEDSLINILMVSNFSNSDVAKIVNLIIKKIII